MDICQPCAFSGVPFKLNKKSKNGQVCYYEMRQEKWKGVVLCSKLSVCLCTEIHDPRSTSKPKLIKVDGTNVTDFSWICKSSGSCWNKFHVFYEPRGQFSKCKIDLCGDKLKFGSYQYASDLYQKKYSALGIVTGRMYKWMNLT
jgi:hypothetical protein